MTRTLVTGSVALGAAVMLLLVGCSAPTPTPTPTPSASAAALTPAGDGVLRIGTILPASGTYAFLGPAQAAGVTLAVKEINDAGGVNGAPVELLSRDSGDASSTKSEAALADLVANKVDVVIGPTSSAQAQRLIPLAADDKIAMISPAATFPGLSEVRGGTYFFRTIPSYGRQGTALGPVLAQDGPKKIAIVYVNDDLGKAIVPTLTDSIAASGSTVVASVTVPLVSPDTAKLVAQVTAAAPDSVVLVTAYSSFDLTKDLITKLVGAGFGGAKLWLTSQNAGDYSQALSAGFLNGVNGIIDGYQPDDAFIARLKSADSALTQFRYGAEAYDATILAALAALVARDDSGQSVAATLRDVSRGGIKCTSFAECLEVLRTQSDIDYDGVSGSVNFTSVQDVSPAFWGLYTFNSENKFVFGRGVIAE
ncbi:MAG: ABC transporter substrate-binding protein [Rhodoglobus sp.]